MIKFAFTNSFLLMLSNHKGVVFQWPLGEINTSAWVNKLLITAELVCPVDYASFCYLPKV